MITTLIAYGTIREFIQQPSAVVIFTKFIDKQKQSEYRGCNNAIRQDREVSHDREIPGSPLKLFETKRSPNWIAERRKKSQTHNRLDTNERNVHENRVLHSLRFSCFRPPSTRRVAIVPDDKRIANTRLSYARAKYVTVNWS